MAAAMRRPPPPGVPGRRGSPNVSQTANLAARSSSQSAAPSAPSSAPGAGPGRGRGGHTAGGTNMAARASMKRGNSGLSSANASVWLDDSDEDARGERLALTDDLRERLQKAELLTEEYRKQFEIMQMRLDEALKAQTELEERVHEEEETADSLVNENKEVLRQRRELESLHEAERAATMKERDELLAREEEQRQIIQRLKDALDRKEIKLSESIELDSERALPPADTTDGTASSDSPLRGEHDWPPNDADAMSPKDGIIESLRLELAEHQIKIAELGNVGAGRFQGLEKDLLEARMANARLMEDNEGYQLLLSEKTLNGDFARGEFMRDSSAINDRPITPAGPSTSLADELETAASAESDVQRRLEMEVANHKEQNRALTLYINNIIERLLNHKDFESVLDKTPDILAAPPRKPDTEKELPPPPPRNSGPDLSELSQRRRSIPANPTSYTNPVRSRPRPMSFVPIRPSAGLDAVSYEAGTAAKGSLQRISSMKASDGAQQQGNPEWRGVSLANQIYRGTLPAPSPGRISPTISPPRGSFFSSLSSAVNETTAAPLPKSREDDVDSRTSLDNSFSGSSNTPDKVTARDPPSSIDGSSPPRPTNDRPVSVMAGNKPRPLRLVQESAADSQAEQAARNKANRSSWVPGWFAKAIPEDEAAGNRRSFLPASNLR